MVFLYFWKYTVILKVESLQVSLGAGRSTSQRLGPTVELTHTDQLIFPLVHI